MWLEAIIAKADIAAILPEIAPVTIRLEGGGSLELDEPCDAELVDGIGLRLSCKAKVHWPVLGIKVPVTVKSATALMMPQIKDTPLGDRLVFTFALEKADFAGLPDMVDHKITEKINEALGKDDARLEWDFTDTLSHDFPLPESLKELKALVLKAAWGEVRVTKDALVLAVSFHAHMKRDATDSDAQRASTTVATA